MAAGLGLYLWRVQQQQQNRPIAIPAAAAIPPKPQLTRQRSEPKRTRKPAQHSDYDVNLNEQHRKELQLEIAVNKFLYSHPSSGQDADRVDLLFEKYDTNKEGKVDKKELLPLLSSMLDDFKVTSQLVTDDRTVLDAAVDEAFKKSDSNSASAEESSFTKKEFREYAEQFLLSILSRSPNLAQ